MSILHNSSTSSSLATTILSFALLALGCDEYESVATSDGETAAQREACPTIGAAQGCGDGEGTQFCASFAGEIAWGECLVDFPCMPGDSEECVLVDGVPQLKQDVYGATADDEGTTPVSENGEINLEDPEPYAMKNCYGGTGWWCCDFYDCYRDIDLVCVVVATECEVP